MKGVTIPEKVIENAILELLWYRGVFAWKVQSTGIFDSSKKVYRKSNNKFHINGVSDILGITFPGGRLLAIEVKSKTGKPSEDQITFINNVNANGGLAFVARSVEEVERILREEGIINHGEKNREN